MFYSNRIYQLVTGHHNLFCPKSLFCLYGLAAQGLKFNEDELSSPAQPKIKRGRDNFLWLLKLMEIAVEEFQFRQIVKKLIAKL